MEIAFDKNSKLMNLAGLSAILLGLFTIYKSIISSLFIPLLPFIIILVYNGIKMLATNGMDIDKTNNKFRIYSKLFGIKHGKWKHLSAPLYLSLFKNIQVPIKAIYGETDSYKEVYELNLFYNDTEFITLLEDTDYKTVAKAGNKIAYYLNTNRLNTVTNQPQWVHQF